MFLSPYHFLFLQCYSNRGERHWELKKFDEAVHENNTEMNKKEHIDYEQDMENFMEQLESDKEMRSQVNLYKKKLQKADSENCKNLDEIDEEEVRLDELLDDMSLNEELASENVNNAEIQVLSLSDANNSTALNLNFEQTEFDVSRFEIQQFKFL